MHASGQVREAPLELGDPIDEVHQHVDRARAQPLVEPGAVGQGQRLDEAGRRLAEHHHDVARLEAELARQRDGSGHGRPMMPARRRLAMAPRRCFGASPGLCPALR
jgi:hypothetical protein